MKKLILKSLLIGLPLLTVSIESNAWIVYRRTCTGGNNNLYDKTHINTTLWKKTISCADPGQTSCPTVLAAGGTSAENDLMLYALDQIASGNLSGSYTNSTGRTVTWSGSDINNNTLEID